jgi:carbonic anhydrase/acetyltransferase-like protein (isoleucine patch superfamily)
VRPLISALGGVRPEIPPSAWVAPGAYVLGAVTLGEEASVWYGSVLRGDIEPITVGDRTNIQDGCVLHTDRGHPLIIGAGCTVGHNAVVHGCEIEDGCLVGMSATILTGVKIGGGSIVGAGAVVTEGSRFPPRSLILGVPARRIGEVSEEQAARIPLGAEHYTEHAARHREGLSEL